MAQCTSLQPGSDPRGSTRPTSDSYAVIGAGASGLAAAKNLTAAGIACEVLEAHSDLGGIWDRSNPRSSMYASAHTITSKLVTAYEGFPLADELPTYPHHEEVLGYLRDYADAFALRPLIRFGREVSEVLPVPGGWSVTTTDQVSRTYRGLIIANGHNWAPRTPDYPGTFDGPTLHASDYDEPSVFTGKRVLVVGAGNSGCDIAVDAARHADSVLISMRRGYYFVPKFVFGRPVDQIGQSAQSSRLPIGLLRTGYRAMLRLAFGRPQDYGLPAPTHRLLESPPIVNSLLPYYVGHGRIRCRPDIAALDGEKVTFVDGRTDAVDLIVYATGYRVEMPFIASEHLSWHDDRPDLYLLAMAREHDNLFVAGLTDGTGGHFPTVDLQTQLIARYIAASDAGTAAARRLSEHKRAARDDVSGGITFIDSPRSLTQFELATYRRHLHRHLDDLS